MIRNMCVCGKSSQSMTLVFNSHVYGLLFTYCRPKFCPCGIYPYYHHKLMQLPFIWIIVLIALVLPEIFGFNCTGVTRLTFLIELCVNFIIISSVNYPSYKITVLKWLIYAVDRQTQLVNLKKVYFQFERSNNAPWHKIPTVGNVQQWNDTER